MKKAPKSTFLFRCINCSFICSRKPDWNRHLGTAKHAKLITYGAELMQITPHHICSVCQKKYKSNVGLWKHKKTCTLHIDTQIDTQLINKDNIIDLLIKENSEFKNIVLEVVKSNSELHKQNNELQTQLVEVCKISKTTINSNNKTFNLQFFLNEQCKDAMNISEFVKTFDLQLTDLESVGELGYVEGITKIMIDKLNSMDIYKRPIHCSDAKREIMYVKDEDKWEKEGRNNPKLRHAIKTVSFQNMKLANLWSNTYPESKNNESHLNDTYMKLIRQSTGGSGDIGNNEDKIIRRIAKEVIIGK
jgi:hypothetical protein